MSERDIFIAALQKDDPAQRQAYLEEACAGQPELRRQVENLLRLHEGAGSFLDQPAQTPTKSPYSTVEPPGREKLGTFIGPYKLIELIGEGGMGTVWMAQQTEPVKRVVAVKLIKPGMDSKQVIARFEAERQALALMDHPNIARVLDGGTTKSEAGGVSPGRPYFVMDLVKGVPITRYCDEHRLTPRQRVELFLPVCQALQHAHQKGIIHRDLKPSNVLVALYDGKPVPKVIDFGVAKAAGQSLTDKTLVTGFGAIVGTLEYMSPEQAEINQLDIDTRSDIYSLGVLLYELLTGSPPFSRTKLEKAGMLEMLRVIREQEPSRPSTKLSTAEGLPTLAANRGTEPAKLTRLVRGELDWIVMKALEKDRDRRYETANGLARDIQRYLNDEPVQACPPSLRYRLGKFGRKHGTLLATAAAFAVLLIALAVGATASAWRLGVEEAATSQQLQETLKAQRETKLELYHSLVERARANRLSRRIGRRHRSLDILADATRLARELQLPEDDILELRNEIIACLPLVDLRVAKSWEGHPAGTVHLDFDANLERYVRFDHLKNVASVRNVADDSEVCRIAKFAQSREPWLVVLSPDGQFLGLVDRSICKVWNVTSQRAELLLEEDGIPRFSPDSRLLAIARQDGAISIYQLPSGKQLKHWQAGLSLQNWPFSHCSLAFHPEKPQLAVSNSGKITVFDLDTGNKLAEFPQPKGKDNLEWHPDGKRLASGDADRCIYLWDAYSGKSLGRLVGHTNDSIRLAFRPAGDLLASTCWDGTLRLWDIERERELLKTSWNAGALQYLHFSRDGRLLAADVADRQLRLWEVIPPCGYQSLVREPHLGKAEYFGCAVSGKHPLLAVGMADGVGLWELPGGRPVAFLPIGPYHGVAFERSGALLTFGVGPQRRWPIEAHGPPGTLRIGPPQPLPFPASIGHIATSKDGRVMASGRYGGALVWHADMGNELIKLTPQLGGVIFVAVSPNGQWVATGSHGTTDIYVKVWDARSGRHIADLPVEGSSLVGFSPEGRWLLTTGGGCRLWSVGTWREGPKIRSGAPNAFAFSPDGKVVAVEAGTGTVLLLDPDTGREYARLEDPHQDRAGNLAFSQDGSQLFASSQEGLGVHAWDLRAIRAELAKRGLDWDLLPYPAAGDPKDAPPLRVDVVSQDGALAHVKLGEWEQAASTFALLVESDPNEHWYWYRSATLSLQTGKRQEYRRICREMLTRFCDTDDPYIAERVAKTCSLAPGAVSDLAPVLKLADRAVTGTEKHGGYRWFVLAKGLAEYRAGHYGAAVDWLNRASPNADGAEWDAAVLAVLAMAKHGLGLGPGADATRLAGEARSALGHALACLSKMPDPKAGRPFGKEWPFSVDAFDAWLHAQILVHEAEKLLGKDEK